jgi:KDO2-lipid IV(A) lauroyltransferase
MKKIADLIIAAFLFSLGIISRVTNIKLRAKIGEYIGDLFRIINKSRRDITLNNISMAFPEKGNDWHKRIMRESYRNLGITMMELLAFPKFTIEDFHNYIKYENFEIIDEILSRGNGVILLSGHFGNWELIAFTVGIFAGISVTEIVKPQSNSYIDKLLNKYRSLSGNNIVQMSNAARAIVKTLKSNGAVGLLVDQSADWRKDLFVDFFGRSAVTYEAPASLSLKFKTPIIMGFPIRKPDYTYSISLIELKSDDLVDSKESIRILTERHVKILENAIRQNPGLWSWQHKRWKHTPPGKKDE